MKTITTKSGKILTVRPLQKGNLAALYQYAKTIEKEDTFITLNPKEPLPLKEEEEFLKNTISQIKEKKKVYFIIFDGKKIVGTSQIGKSGRRRGHIGIFGIALLKSYRSQGIGKKLMKFIIKEAQKTLKITKIDLSCFANNTIGIKLYKNLEFIQYGVRPQAILYKGKLIDELLFYKDLIT